jgi:hypothetical protein
MIEHLAVLRAEKDGDPWDEEGGGHEVHTSYEPSHGSRWLTGTTVDQLDGGFVLRSRR